MKPNRLLFLFSFSFALVFTAGEALSPVIFLYRYNYDLLYIYCPVFQGVHCWVPASQRLLLMVFAGMWSAVIRSSIRISEFQLRNSLCYDSRERNHTLNLLTPSKHDAVCSWVILRSRRWMFWHGNWWCVPPEKSLPVRDVSRRKWKRHGSPFPSEEVQSSLI